MTRQPLALLIFESIHQVLAAEKALAEAGLAPDLVPVPKEVSANCGMAITIAASHSARALALLATCKPARVLNHWAP